VPDTTVAVFTLINMREYVNVWARAGDKLDTPTICESHCELDLHIVGASPATEP